MKHWLQLATRNWQTKPARSLLAVLAVTLGVGVVVWVTCCYESVRRGVNEVVLQWIGRSHVIIESSHGVWGTFDADVEQLVEGIEGVKSITTRTREYVDFAPAPPGDASFPASGDYVRIEATGIRPDRMKT